MLPETASSPSPRVVVARVVRLEGALPEVELPGGARVPVRLAMAVGHRPVEGDELLVIGDEHGFYAIGVVSSQGEIRVELPADVAVHASGDLELVGDEGVHVQGKTIRLTSETMQLSAEALKQTATRMIQRVRGLLSSHSGEKREVVSGEISTRADRASLMGRTVVTINGKEIHLG